MAGVLGNNTATVSSFPRQFFSASAMRWQRVNVHPKFGKYVVLVITINDCGFVVNGFFADGGEMDGGDDVVAEFFQALYGNLA